jgi:recombination protein RecR
MKYPDSVENLIKCFEMYPGIGPKTAQRLAFFTVSKMSKENAQRFSKSITDVIELIKNCDICGAITDQDICDVCSDEDRDNTIMVVENSKDIMAFEKTNVFKGKYHVLNGNISPLNGVGPDDINLSSLYDRIKKEKVEKVIIALSSTIPGEMTSQYIKKMLEEKEIVIYRIGYGLPAGADIEYADEITLTKALEGMKKI